MSNIQECILNKSQLSFYPISLDEIKLKVARKHGRKNKLNNNGDSWPLDNVKEIIIEKAKEYRII